MPWKRTTKLLLAVGVALPCAQAAHAANLLGQWTFNETAEDLTGNGNNAVFGGDPSFVSLGPTNQGISLNPSAGQYVDYGSSPLFSLTTAFTLESWVTIRALPSPGGEPLIFGKDHTLYGMTYYSNGNFYAYVGGGSNTVATPLSLNQAYHLVQTWDGSTIRVYRNGVLSGTLASSAAPPTNGGNNLLSGRPGPSDGTPFLNAIIDETRIYSGALTPAEVTANFQAGPAQVVPRWIAQSGDWHTPSNWVGGVPNAPGAVANFADSLLAPGTVVIDQPTTVGTLTFGSAQQIVLAGASSLSLQVSSGSASVLVNQGSHRINLPSFFASNTQITILGGSTLTLGNPVTIRAGNTVTSSGALRIESPLIIESGGTLALGSGVTVLRGVPELGGGATVELTDGVCVVDYSGFASPAAQVQALLRDHEIVAQPSGNSLLLGWRDRADLSVIEIRRTFGGDADLSGAVDSTDFNRFIAGYGKTSDATWSEGDFSYDGAVNTLDFNLLAGSFGSTLPGPLTGTMVPEPANLIAVVTLLLASRFCRR